MKNVPSNKFLKYAEARVPRYTSYPTALHFHEHVSVETHKAWLQAIGKDDSLSLYVHIPFCAQMCWYCGCNTTVTSNYDRASIYLAALLKEIHSVSRLLGPNKGVKHIHFGGGTPTYLKPDDFKRLMNAIHHVFDVHEDAEIAVEIDPRTMSYEMAITLGTVGVNRASIGVQDFDVDVQQLINRLQSTGMVQKTMQWLYASGVTDISFDLMYGLPGQTVDTVRETASLAAAMKPARISLFGYAHVPWFKKHQQLIQESKLPNTEQRLAMSAVAADVLTSAGYVAIGFDHFAVPADPLAIAQEKGTLTRNFQGYTNDQTDYLIALGASAISRLPGGYAQNNPHLKEYRDQINDCGFGTTKGVAVTEEDNFFAGAIMRLLCDFKLDAGAYAVGAGRDETALDDCLQKLTPFIDDGLCTLSGRTVEMVKEARPYVRVVATVFDQYLKPASQKHSQAI